MMNHVMRYIPSAELSSSGSAYASRTPDPGRKMVANDIQKPPYMVKAAKDEIRHQLRAPEGSSHSGRATCTRTGRRQARTGGTKCVLSGKLPHAGDKLGKAPNEEGHAENDVGMGDPPRLNVVQGEDEGRRRESEQPTTRML